MDTMPAGPGYVSHYRLLSKIGAGGMGEVWLAEDTQLPRKVAVKLLPRDAARDPQAVARLLREAQAAATVDHPAVVTVYEAGVSSGAPYLVMQRVEGETLSERLTRGPLPVAEAVTLAERVADALAEVHALGIVHRDLKPSNIILGPRGPKVVDFGVASLKGAAELTSPGSVIGTPLTMSPEQVTGRPADNRSDLWALGVVLYAALTGREPFAGETLASRIFGRRLAATATELVPAGGHARSRPGRDQIAAQGPRSAVRAGGGSPRRPSCLPGRVERRGARASEAPRTARGGALLRGARLFTGGWLPRSRFDRRSDRRSDTPGRIARRLARGRPRLSRPRRATAYAGT